MWKNAGPKGRACRRSNTLRRSDEHETACGHNSGDAHSIESRRCKGECPNLSGKRTGSDAGGNPACAVTLHLCVAHSDIVIINRPTENELLQAGFNVQFLRKRKIKMFPDAKKSQMREFRIRGDARQCRFAGGAKLARTGK